MTPARPYRLLSDERLATLAGNGSDAAFAALYRRYDALVNGYSRSITRDPDDARDALQNAMVKVLVALRRNQLRSAYRPWLFRIVHNEAVNVLQRRSGAEPLSEPDTAGSVAGADEVAAARERVSEVVSDLMALPLAQRAALVMRELCGMPYDEIAAALQTSEVNARQLVFAARASLADSDAGRALPCESVRGYVLHADGRQLRRRPLRAHLRACAACRDFAGEARRDRRPARAAAGWLPLPGLGWLQGLAAAWSGGVGTAVSQGPGGIGPALTRSTAVLAVVGAGLGTAEMTIRDRLAEPQRGGAAVAKREKPATGSKATKGATVKRVTVAAKTSARVRTVAAVEPAKRTSRPAARRQVSSRRVTADTPRRESTPEPDRARATQPAPRRPRDDGQAGGGEDFGARTYSGTATRSSGDCSPREEQASEFDAGSRLRDGGGPRPDEPPVDM